MDRAMVGGDITERSSKEQRRGSILFVHANAVPQPRVWFRAGFSRTDQLTMPPTAMKIRLPPAAAGRFPLSRQG